ncbi:hypothetical protein [Longicatena caecimuris]
MLLLSVGRVRQCPSTECPLWRYRMGKEERDELYGGKGAMKQETEVSENE